MKVSFIIPTRNGGKYLGRLFETLKEQSVSPDQILVVDSSSKGGKEKGDRLLFLFFSKTKIRRQ